MREQPLFTLSTCGTSVWTNRKNGMTEAERDLVTKHTNAASAAAVPPEDREILRAALAQVRTAAQNFGPTEAGRLSAELKGILALYGGDLRGGADQHLLLCTDTWLGRESAELVGDWLRGRGVTVTIHQQKGLRTRSLDEFQMALSELVQWCEEVMSGYRAARYRIVFNLTGGLRACRALCRLCDVLRRRGSVHFRVGNGVAADSAPSDSDGGGGVFPGTSVGFSSAGP